jgi:hypothetical protein
VHQATVAAGGKSYRRDGSSLSEISRVLSLNYMSSNLLTLLIHGATAGQLIEALPQSREKTEAQIAELEEAGIIKQIEDEAKGDDRLFTTGWRALETDEWKKRDLEEREELSAEIVWVLKEEMEEAMSAGTFDSRPDRHLVRLPMWLDEEGWRELSAALNDTFDSCLEIQKRVQNRLKGNEAGEGEPARVILVSFPTPTPPSELD